MLRTTIFPGRYVQGQDARKRLGKELERFGEEGFVVCGNYVAKNLLQDFEPYLSNGIHARIEEFGGECSDEEIQRLLQLVKSSNPDFIVGLGGGKVIDTAKAVANQSCLPVAVVPTIAATDAPCSALSVIYTEGGEFRRLFFHRKNPDLVLVDTQIIADAPVELLVSGMGDALATWFEAQSSMSSYAANMTGDLGSFTAYTLARLCYDTILEYGILAKSACENGVVTPALERIVEANTLLSGLGFESGGLGAAHAIHNGFTVLPEARKRYHGQKVAFGTIASLFLTDKPAAIIGEVYDFCESVGLPTTLTDLGLIEISDDELMKVAHASCAEEETIHNESIPVTPYMVFAAIKAADAEGKRRRKYAQERG